MIAVFQDGSVETKSWYFLKVRIESFLTIPYLNQSEVGGLRSKLNKLVEKYGEIPLSASNQRRVPTLSANGRHTAKIGAKKFVFS